MDYSGTGQPSMTDRMMRAARLEPQLYEEVEHDLTATSQALTVVMVVAVAGGIGQALGQIMAGRPAAAIAGFIAGLLAALIGWAIWSGLSYFIGTKLFGGVATYGELLRTVGFANSPGVLNILSFVPILGGLVAFAVFIWVLCTTVVAMRQALDIDTTKAVLTAVISLIPYFILSAVLIGPIILLTGGAGR